MKKTILIITGLLLFSCAKKEKQPETKPENELQKTANAAGFEGWDSITEIRFTFNVDRDTIHFERSWIWKPKESHVTMVKDGDTTAYTRTMPLDTAYVAADKAFINDKYWLLAPFNMVWDSVSHTVEEKSPAPIKGDSLKKITIVYGSEGGYTPGDAYDFFVDESNLVKEWAYRSGNAPEPSMVTTWENYQDFGPLRLALMHQNKEGTFKLYFTNVAVNTQ